MRFPGWEKRDVVAQLFFSSMTLRPHQISTIWYGRSRSKEDLVSDWRKTFTPMLKVLRP